MSYKGNYRSYAAYVSKELGIDISQILAMTMAEIEEISKARFSEQIAKKKADEDWILKLKLLLKDFDRYYEEMGDDFLTAYCCFDEDDIYNWSYSTETGVDYETEDAKRLLIKKDDRRYGYYSGGSFLNIRSYIMDDVLTKAIELHYPQFLRYKPEILHYHTSVQDTEMRFTIIRKKTTKDFSEDDFEEASDKTFECTLDTFFRMDWDAMLEEYLESINFSEVKSRDDEKFKRVNAFTSSPEMAEFIKTVKNTKAAKEEA